MVAMSMILDDSKLYSNQNFIKESLKEFYEIKNILNEITDKHKELLDNEFDKINKLKESYKKAILYKDNGLSCDSIAQCKEIEKELTNIDVI